MRRPDHHRLHIGLFDLRVSQNGGHARDNAAHYVGRRRAFRRREYARTFHEDGICICAAYIYADAHLTPNRMLQL